MQESILKCDKIREMTSSYSRHVILHEYNMLGTAMKGGIPHTYHTTCDGVLGG